MAAEVGRCRADATWFLCTIVSGTCKITNMKELNDYCHTVTSDGFVLAPRHMVIVRVNWSCSFRYDIARQYVDRIQWSSGQDVQRIVDEQAISSLAKGPSMASDPPALHGLLEQAAASESQLMAVAVWLRFATARLLVWNHNYNVKPREISTSQDGVTSVVAKIWRTW